MDFGGKVMSLLFNMLSRLVITFLPRIRGMKKKGSVLSGVSVSWELWALWLPFYVYLFIIYFWLLWVFLATPGLSLVAGSWDYFSLQ